MLSDLMVQQELQEELERLVHQDKMVWMEKGVRLVNKEPQDSKENAVSKALLESRDCQEREVLMGRMVLQELQVSKETEEEMVDQVCKENQEEMASMDVMEEMDSQVYNNYFEDPR